MRQYLVFREIAGLLRFEGVFEAESYKHLVRALKKKYEGQTLVIIPKKFVKGVVCHDAKGE